MRKKGKNNKEDKESESVPFTPKEEVDQAFKNLNITIENDIGYDVVYVYHMAKADYYESSIKTEENMLLWVKDYIDDIDGYNGLPMTRFYADCVGSGTPIM